MNANPVSVDVWWTPDCGHLHYEKDPVTIPAHCPDGEPKMTEDTP